MKKKSIKKYTLLFVFLFQLFINKSHSDIISNNTPQNLKEDSDLLFSGIENMGFISSIAEPPSSYRGILSIVKGVSVKLALISNNNLLYGETNYKSDFFTSYLSRIRTEFGFGFPRPLVPIGAFMVGVNVLGAFTVHAGGFPRISLDNIILSDFGVSGKWTITKTLFPQFPLSWAIRAYYGQFSVNTVAGELDLATQVKTFGGNTSLGLPLSFIPFLPSLEPYLGAGLQTNNPKIKTVNPTRTNVTLETLNSSPPSFYLNTFLGIHLGYFALEYKQFFKGRERLISSKLTLSFSMTI